MSHRNGSLFALAVFMARGVLLLPGQNIPLPVIPAAAFNIRNYGAVGDGRTLDTAALQKTMDACAAAGGGTVLVPAGNYLTGPFTLVSSLNLHLVQRLSASRAGSRRDWAREP